MHKLVISMAAWRKPCSHDKIPTYLPLHWKPCFQVPQDDMISGIIGIIMWRHTGRCSIPQLPFPNDGTVDVGSVVPANLAHLCLSGSHFVHDIVLWVVSQQQVVQLHKQISKFCRHMTLKGQRTEFWHPSLRILESARRKPTWLGWGGTDWDNRMRGHCAHV